VDRDDEPVRRVRGIRAGLEIPPGTPVAEHIRTGYTRTDVAARVMISIIPGDTMILEYKIPT
jgi:GntR family transcriptional regulator